MRRRRRRSLAVAMAGWLSVMSVWFTATTTEPKARSMMMMAAKMPMPSLGPGFAPATSPMACPPTATWNPGAENDCAVLTT